jgi:hypothetical protein
LSIGLIGTALKLKNPIFDPSIDAGGEETSESMPEDEEL